MTHRLHTIIVPVDETAHSERALHVASALARHTHASVDLVTVQSPNLDATEVRSYHERIGAQHFAGVIWSSRIDLTNTGVAESLVQRADGTSDRLLCMSTHARNAFGDIVLGSVGDRVVELENEWVLLVGPRCALDGAALDRWLHGPVHAFLDGTDVDPGTTAIAMRWAALTGQEVIFTSIAPPDRPRRRRSLEANLSDYVEDATTSTSEIIDSYDVVGSVVRTAERDGGSIVVGTHHRSALARVVSGSASVWAAHRASCPILVACASAGADKIQALTTADATAK